jgi:hypothetical protein
VVILYEGNIHSYRQIFLDRNTHLKDAKDLWYGDSIGHWDGDTLVVDSLGFNDRFWFDMAGHPHTTQLHVTEKYHRRDLGNLEVLEQTFADRHLHQALGGQARQLPERGIEMSEYVCNENNSDALHLVGK